jgi:hypothetical protein
MIADYGLDSGLSGYHRRVFAQHIRRLSPKNRRRLLSGDPELLGWLDTIMKGLKGLGKGIGAISRAAKARKARKAGGAAPAPVVQEKKLVKRVAVKKKINPMLIYGGIGAGVLLIVLTMKRG